MSGVELWLHRAILVCAVGAIVSFGITGEWLRIAWPVIAGIYIVRFLGESRRSARLLAAVVGFSRSAR
jgi:hypothetical protein